MTHILGLGAKRGIGFSFGCFNVVDQLCGVGIGKLFDEGLALTFLLHNLLLQLDCTLCQSADLCLVKAILNLLLINDLL